MKCPHKVIIKNLPVHLILISSSALGDNCLQVLLSMFSTREGTGSSVPDLYDTVYLGVQSFASTAITLSVDHGPYILAPIYSITSAFIAVPPCLIRTYSDTQSGKNT